MAERTPTRRTTVRLYIHEMYGGAVLAVGGRG